MRHERDITGDALILPLDIELERTGRTVRRLAAGLILFVCFALGVMALSPVREVASAIGEIAPTAEIAEVRHLDGGEVQNLSARHGDMVRLGDPLVTLRPLRSEADLRQLTARRAHLRLRNERLLALMDGREPSFREDVELPLGVIDNERALFASERLALEKQIASLEARRDQKQFEAESKRAEAAGLEQEIAAYAHRLRMRETLLERQVASLDQVLELRARVAEAHSRLSAAEGAARAADGAAAEAESEIARAVAEKRNEWSRSQLDVAAQLSELERNIAKLRDQVDRLVIRAPVAGRVLEFGGLTVGGVVPPGGLAAKIVPIDTEMIAEVRISPDDIGHVEIGSEAEVTITTYDRERTGQWVGVVMEVSPAAFENERGDRFFTAQLSLAHIGEGEAPLLTAGMAVQADIRTGSKSILRYLLKPIIRVAERAFSER